MTSGKNLRAAAGGGETTRPAARQLAPTANPADEQEAHRHRRLWLRYALQTPQPRQFPASHAEPPHARNRI